MEFIEKYLIIGIKYPRQTITDVIRAGGYNYIIDPVTVIKENKDDLFVDFGEYNTKEQALKRLQDIYGNPSDVRYWSILPVMVVASTQEIRAFKLKRIYKKIKGR